MNRKFNDKADTSATLIKNEKYFEDIKNNEKQRIYNSYSDMIDWLMLLYDYPIHVIEDDNAH